MNSIASRLMLNTGYTIPKLALGTWLAQCQNVFEATLHALRVGYRHIDTAYAYKNEKEIGKAVHEFLQENPHFNRNDIFITTKVWNTFHSAENVLRNCDMSLQNLNVDYVDLYLMHWPMGYKENTGDDVFVPKDPQGKPQYSDVDFLETYKAMESLVASGKVRNLGVCNFNMSQLKRLLANCTIKPAVLQNEIHPYCPEFELIDLCKKENIVVEAYAPIGAPNRPRAGETDPCLLEDETIKRISNELDCSTASVLIAWCLARGVVCLVKSVNSRRIEENYQAQSVQLNDSMIAQIDGISDRTKFKFYLHKDGSGHPEYPFKKF